jgi:hypothetical protein
MASAPEGPVSGQFVESVGADGLYKVLEERTVD